MRLLSSVMLLLVVISAQAKVLGVYGQTYPIIEHDFLKVIHARLSDLEKHGDIQHWQDQFKETVKRHVIRPTPVAGMTRATEYREWLYDPSITLDHDILDTQGQVIATKGTHVNPLTTVPLTRVLVFLDGDDEKQVAWAMHVIKRRQQRVKLILVNGDVKDNHELFQMPVYFDQHGVLTTRFGIEHVPATVKQVDQTLQVSEEVV